MFSRAFSRISWLLMLSAAALMTACGGGSGNPSDTTPIHMIVTAPNSYGPIKVEIFGGYPPFYIRTNSTLVDLPEKSDSRTVYGFLYPCSDDGTRSITVWDDIRGSPMYGSTVTFETTGIPFEPSSLTVTPGPGSTDCTTGTSGDYAQICAGTQGVANLQLNTNDPRNAGQWVRFSVALGDFDIRDANTGTWGASAVTTTDMNSSAQVAIRARADAQTQIARIRAELTDGRSIETSFVILGATFRMLPTTAAWTSTGTTCPSRTASFSLFGGVPPYSVQTTLGSVNPSTVSASGGSTVLTVAVCGTGELTARDTVGNTASASISYTATPQQEPEQPEPPPPPIVIAPVPANSWGAQTAAGRVSCTPNTVFNFTVSGGTPPYVGAFVSPMGLTTDEIAGPVGRVTFNNAPAAANTNVTVFVTDSDGSMGTRIIYCQ